MQYTALLLTMGIALTMFPVSRVRAAWDDTSILRMPARDICLRLADLQSPTGGLRDSGVSVINVTLPGPVTGPGADPAGSLDSYDALQAAATSLSGKSDWVLVFPKGTYFIDRYIDPAQDAARRAKNIVFSSARRFRIIGCNATISVTSDFVRTPGAPIASRPGMFVPRESIVTPLELENVSDFSVEGVDQDGSGGGYGLELDGSIDRFGAPGTRTEGLTRDVRLSEGVGSGLVTSGASRYVIDGVFAHHFPVDGFYIGKGFVDESRTVTTLGKKVYKTLVADASGTISNVRSAHNARQGISIVQVAGVTVRDSVFSDNGRTGNGGAVNLRFPGFQPMAGADVEPNYGGSTVCVAQCASKAPTYVRPTSRTTDVVFERCTFENNVGSQFVTGVGGKAYGTKLVDATVLASMAGTAGSAEFPGSSERVVVLAAQTSYVTGGIIETGAGAVYASNVDTAKLPKGSDLAQVSTYITGVTIRTKGSGIVSVGDRTLRVMDSWIIGGHDASFRGYVPYIQNRNPESMFRHNNVSIPSVIASGSVRRAVGLVQGMCNAETKSVMVGGNTWSLDGALPAADMSLLVSYRRTRVTEQESFPSSPFLRSAEDHVTGPSCP